MFISDFAIRRPIVTVVVMIALAVAAANVPVRAGQSIVVVGREFPSGTYTWRELARRTGARLVTVTLEAGESGADA
jgi:selenocysteine lyase/cysteine desulfurase